MQFSTFTSNILLAFILMYVIHFVIRPRLWKRYQRTEFMRQKDAPKTKVAPKWQYNILAGIGIVTVATTFFALFWWLPQGIFYLRHIYRSIPLTQGIQGLDILLYFVSLPFGFVSGIFLVNTLSYFYFPSFIKRDLLRNMRNIHQSVEPEISEQESEKKILEKYDITKIQNHDWVLLLRIWSILTLLMVGICLLFLLVL